MADETADLTLPYLLASQAQKHVTENESLARSDGLVQLAVQSRTITVEPGAKAPKPMHKSKTLIFLMAAALVQLGQTVSASDGQEWLLPALGQLQLFLMGMAGVSRAVAVKPLK